MRTTKVFIEMTPKGKQLPFSFGGRRIKDSKTRAYEAQLRSIMKAQFNGAPLYDVPIGIKVIFGLPRPKTVKRKIPSVKPDLDNLIKGLDSGTGVLWVDDQLICKIAAQKVYADTGFIDLTIEEIVE